jgi:hypothetical protein
MDKQVWSNRCTCHLSSSVALWRGGSRWTKEFGVTNARVTSLAQWLYGKEAHPVDKQMIPCPHQTNYNIKSGSPLKGWVILQF